ncbi:MAG: hypothetical protein OEW84_07150 [Aigarchaeota archaeon]|nr:hypothetical protein [Aigarchaeota archaeon]
MISTRTAAAGLITIFVIAVGAVLLMTRPSGITRTTTVLAEKSVTMTVRTTLTMILRTTSYSVEYHTVTVVIGPAQTVTTTTTTTVTATGSM